MSTTTVLELAVLVVALVALVGVLVWLAVLGRRPSRWDVTVAEHYAATGGYPTAAEWRSGRVGWDAVRPAPAPPGPATVTVTAVDGKPVAEGAR